MVCTENYNSLEGRLEITSDLSPEIKDLVCQAWSQHSTPLSHRQEIVESVRQWQTRLLQLDRRNALLYFQMGKRGVTLLDIAPDSLLERLATSRVGLAFLYAERVGTTKNLLNFAEDVDVQEPKIRTRPGDLHTNLPPLELQKRLSALNRRSREWREEQGLNVLFIALGFLRWVDEDSESAYSPILLAPCDLTRVSPRDPYLLGGDEVEDLVVNPTLRHALATTMGIELPEIGEATVAEYLTTVARLIEDHENWRVEPSIVVATFPFSKLAMWEDLNLMVSTGVTHPMVRRLAGDIGACMENEAGELSAIPMDDAKLQGALLDELLDVRNQYAVIDADFSQLRAIELARLGANLVIHGPPGTGKSQTIANIIATLTANGRRVLFVSEKTAALDVVKRRLTEVGLGEFCLDLHSDRGKKDSVYLQLHQALNQPQADPKEFPYERLLARRNELNVIVRSLHEIRQPLGLSVFTVHGRVAEIHDVPRLNIIVHDIAALDDDRLGQIQAAVRRIARRVTQFYEHHTSRWRSLGAISTSPMLAHDVRTDLMLIQSAVDSVLDAAQSASAACGVEVPTTQLGVVRLVRLLGHLGNSPGAIPIQWFETGGLQRALRSINALESEAAERSELFIALSSWINSQPIKSDFRRWLDVALAALAGATRWEWIAGAEWNKVLLIAPHNTAAAWRNRAIALDLLWEASIRLQKLLGVHRCLDSLATAESALTVAERLLKIGKVPAPWCRAEAIVEIRAEVANARKLRDELVSEDRALAETFGPEMIDLVDEEMLVRYRTDHRSFWRRLGTTYRRDNRAIRGCLKRPEKLSLDAATVAIERALAIHRLRAAWSDKDPRIKELLGVHYAGLDSDWPSIESTLDALAAIDREFPVQESTFHTILLDTQLLAQLEDAVQVVSIRVRTLGALWMQSISHRDSPIPELSSTAKALAEVMDRIGVVVDSLDPFVQYPIDLSDLIKLLKIGARLEEIEEGAAAAFASRARDIGDSFSGWATNFGKLNSMLDWTQKLEVLVEPPLTESLVDRVIRALSPEFYATEEVALAEAEKYLQEACATAAARFPEAQTPWGTWVTAPLKEVQSWCNDLYLHSDEASDWVEYRTATLALDAAVCANATDGLRSVTDDAALVPDTLLRHVYLSWLKNIYSVAPVLQFAPCDIEDVQRDFRDLDALLPQLTRERVRAKCLAAYPMSALNSNGLGELGILNRELSKRKRRLPVRKLVARIPNLLQRLKPVFMMSPLAVSQYLPRGSRESDTLAFDTVIFDEASQVFPEDAVPAIARARQSIVVGDQKQLPPTGFFRKGDIEDEEDEDAPEVENRLIGVESILDALVGMSGAGVSDVNLRVHYRSQYDALIRYSNHYFYDDRLLTFPSAFRSRPGLGIRSIYLPDARFEAGGSRTNRVEAERVVQTVFELMESQLPTESIGVVALSRPQADLIQELVDQRRLSDSRFDERFVEHAHERFFVKNLENVQGDERDHMILSIGYGPTTASGMVPNRFGPINAEGGHRRLNVAVSRARKSMTVVHSLRPEDIHSEMRGAQLLRRYLEFLRSEEASIEGAVISASGSEAESPFEEAVGRALERRGYRIQRQVGCAKYWIDIAVVSEDGSGFDLGIECDGATYHRSPSARDRDRLRQEILERLGWRGRIHRVWSTAWIRNPQAEIASIELSIQRARSMPRNQPAAPRIAVSPKPQQVQTLQSELAAKIGISSTTAIVESPQWPAYVKTDLQPFPKGRDLREEGYTHIARLVSTVVEAEGPVHIELVIDRIREHYRLGRAGRLVREAIQAGVTAALKLGKIARLPTVEPYGSHDEFFVTKLDQPVAPRGQMRDGTLRKINHICDQEIDAAIIKVVTEMVGAKREEAIIATARAFGYARTGNLVEDRISSAVDRLIAVGTLKDRLGSLVLAG